MTEREAVLKKLNEINSQAAFNRWLGLTVVKAEVGSAELMVHWREDLGQYSGFLHAGVVAALIDTGCGFAAVTLHEWVTASHFSVNCIAPARGEAFIVKAKVVKSGRKQVFATAELCAISEGSTSLVAFGEVLLVPLAPRA